RPEDLPARHRARMGEWSEEREPSTGESFSARGPWVWVGLGVLLAAIGGMVLWLARSGPGPAAVPPVVATDPQSGGAEAEAASTYEENKSRIEEACRAAEVYLAARSVEELLPLIQHRAALEPRARAFYAGPE